MLTIENKKLLFIIDNSFLAKIFIIKSAISEVTNDNREFNIISNGAIPTFPPGYFLYVKYQIKIIVLNKPIKTKEIMLFSIIFIKANLYNYLISTSQFLKYRQTDISRRFLFKFCLFLVC